MEISKRSWHYRLLTMFSARERVLVCPTCQVPEKWGQFIEAYRPVEPNNLCSYALRVVGSSIAITGAFVVLVLVGLFSGYVLVRLPQLSAWIVANPADFIQSIEFVAILVSGSIIIPALARGKFRLLEMYLSSLKHHYCIPLTFRDER